MLIVEAFGEAMILNLRSISQCSPSHLFTKMEWINICPNNMWVIRHVNDFAM